MLNGAGDRDVHRHLAILCLFRIRDGRRCIRGLEENHGTGRSGKEAITGIFRFNTVGFEVGKQHPANLVLIRNRTGNSSFTIQLAGGNRQHAFAGFFILFHRAEGDRPGGCPCRSFFHIP